MFDSFLVALNAIMPTFLLLTFGYFLKHKNFVSSEFLKQTNTLTFKFFLPFLLFNNIYKTEITEAIDGMTFTIAVGSLLLVFAVLCIVVPRVVREPKQRGVIIQGIFRSNYVIFGVSLVTNVFGAEEAAAASILSAVLVPMYNVLAVIALTVFTGGGTELYFQLGAANPDVCGHRPDPQQEHGETDGRHGKCHDLRKVQRQDLCGD